MNILFDLGHPGHVHLYRHLRTEMEKQGHKTIVIAKNVSSITELLNCYNIPYINIGRKRDSIISKYLSQVIFIIKTLLIVKKYKIDIGIGVSMTLSIVSKFSKMTSIGMDDDDMKATPIFAKYVNQSDYVLTPDCLSIENRGPHHISYPSYHELAYLHPDRFIPDPSVIIELGLKFEESFFILRFNAFKAHHDVGKKGLSFDNKKELIASLSKFGKVFVTSETEIDPEFKRYQIPISPDRIHSLLYYATIFVGDCQTMTSEAAVLGTPSFKCNSFAGKLSIPNELESKYELCFAYQPESFNIMMKNIENYLKTPELKEIFNERRQKMLVDKIELTQFMANMINKLTMPAINAKKNSLEVD